MEETDEEDDELSKNQMGVVNMTTPSADDTVRGSRLVREELIIETLVSPTNEHGRKLNVCGSGMDERINGLDGGDDSEFVDHMCKTQVVQESGDNPIDVMELESTLKPKSSQGSVLGLEQIEVNTHTTSTPSQIRTGRRGRPEKINKNS